MGQSECLKFLEKKDVWLTARELSKEFSQKPSVVIQSLNRLAKHGEILMKKVKVNGAREVTMWHGRDE